MNCPNLKLLLYQAETLMKEQGFLSFDFVLNVFPQMWGSSCLGFDETKNGKPAIGCDVLTEAYTTVIHERVTDTYFVYFDSNLCYVADMNKMTPEAKTVFLDDLKNRNMASRHYAKSRYFQ